MKKIHLFWIGGGIAIALVIALRQPMEIQQPPEPEIPTVTETATVLEAKPKTVPERATQSVVTLSDVYQTADDSEIRHLENMRRAEDEGYGETPAIRELDNPQVQSVIEALKTNEHPSRLSPMIPALAFDPELYHSDAAYRQAYLQTAEPGRAHQSDQDSAYTLTRVSAYYTEVEQGQKVTLTVKGQPRMPVSITSFDLGKLGNGLTFQTVEADGSGYAHFDVYGMSGTIADINLLCSAPSCRGQVKFVVHTQLPGISELTAQSAHAQN